MADGQKVVQAELRRLCEERDKAVTDYQAWLRLGHEINAVARVRNLLAEGE